jgi:hypothetical protein
MKEKLEELERMHREIMHKLNHLVRAVDDIHRHFRKRAEKTHSDSRSRTVHGMHLMEFFDPAGGGTHSRRRSA